MEKERIVMEKLKCVRCGHEWYARKPERPLRCANRECARSYWWRPARVRKDRLLGPVGAPTKYPFHNLQPGQRVLIPWFNTPDGQNRDTKKILSLKSAIYSHARRTGKTFNIVPQVTGLEIHRHS